jgi:hypothetical protein
MIDFMDRVKSYPASLASNSAEGSVLSIDNSKVLVTLR